MQEALPYIFFTGMAIAVLAAVVSLITPRAAIFFRKKTRLRGLFSWLGVAFVCLVLVSVSIPREQREAARQAAAEARAMAEAQKPRLVPYRVTAVDDTSTGVRKRGDVRIVLADPAADFRPQDLAATCMAAARFYAKEYGFKTVSVFFTDIPGERPWQGTQIARCHHAPDKKGFHDGNWEWDDVRAAERPYTDQERQVKQLWGELVARGMHKTSDIQKAVAQKLGIPEGQVPTPPFLLSLEQVDERPFMDVKPHGPEK